jgi:hypothetical protein
MNPARHTHDDVAPGHQSRGPGQADRWITVHWFADRWFTDRWFTDRRFTDRKFTDRRFTDRGLADRGLAVDGGALVGDLIQPGGAVVGPIEKPCIPTRAGSIDRVSKVLANSFNSSV